MYCRTMNFFKIIFLMCTFFFLSLEFVIILLLFYVLVFWAPGMWDLSSLIRDWNHIPWAERRSLNHWTTREVLWTMDFKNHIACHNLFKHNCWTIVGHLRVPWTARRSNQSIPKKSQGWSSEWTGWISLQSKGLSRVFSNTTVQNHQFLGTQPSSQSNSHIHTWPQEKP